MQPRHATALLVLVALAASLPAIANGFVQDDIPIIVGDFRLHDLTQWPRLLVEPYWPPPFAPDQYRPLTAVLLSVQFITGGGSPIVFRLVTALLYAAAALAVWGLLRTLLPGRDRVALGAALLFAAHPVHVEATALGVGQAEILMTLFSVFGVTRYLRMREGNETGARPWGVIALCYLGAALAKEQGLLLPLVLLAAEWLVIVPSRRSSRRALVRGWAAIGAVGLVIVATRVAVLGAVAAPVNVAEALQDSPLGIRLATALQLVPHWLRLLVWPAHLRADYSPQEFVASIGIGGTELLGLGLLVAVGLVAWTMRRRAPALSYGVAFMAIGLAPVSNVIVATGVLIAERTLFLPSVGLATAIAGGAAWASERWSSYAVRVAAATAVVVLVAGGVAHSARRLQVWHSETALTLATVQDSPRSWRANLNHANLLFDAGQRQAAFQAYERAIALAPSAWQPRHEYARRLRAAGDEQGALDQLGLSLVEQPENREATRDLIAVLLSLGRYAEARAILMQTIGRGEVSSELLALGRLTDSAIAVRAPAGSIRIGLEPVERRMPR